MLLIFWCPLMPQVVEAGRQNRLVDSSRWVRRGNKKGRSSGNQLQGLNENSGLNLHFFLLSSLHFPLIALLTFTFMSQHPFPSTQPAKHIIFQTSNHTMIPFSAKIQFIASSSPFGWVFLHVTFGNIFFFTNCHMNKHTQQTEKKFHFHFLDFLICCLQFCLASLHWAFLPPLLTAASWVDAAKNVQHGLLQAQCKSKTSWNIWIGEPQTRCCTVQDYMVSMGLL